MSTAKYTVTEQRKAALRAIIDGILDGAISKPTTMDELGGMLLTMVVVVAQEAGSSGFADGTQVATDESVRRLGAPTLPLASGKDAISLTTLAESTHDHIRRSYHNNVAPSVVVRHLAECFDTLMTLQRDMDAQVIADEASRLHKMGTSFPYLASVLVPVIEALGTVETLVQTGMMTQVLARCIVPIEQSKKPRRRRDKAAHASSTPVKDITHGS